MIKQCKYCGKPFEAKGTAAYCPGPHYAKCEICGKNFKVDPRYPNKTCSIECKVKLRAKNIQNKVITCKLCGEKFHPINNRNLYCSKPHYSPCEVCGKPVLIKNNDISTLPQVCSIECGKERYKKKCQEQWGIDHHSQRPETIEKIRNTVINSMEHRKQHIKELYGVENVAQIPSVKAKISETLKSSEYQAKFRQNNIQKFGYEYAMQCPELRSKQAKNTNRKSNLEIRLHNFLDEYKIDYQEEYVIGKSNLIHSFDVFLPKYKILIDCDGIYYHSYICDPDGNKSREDYDDVRISLIPEDHYFCLIVESDFEHGLKVLQDMIRSQDENMLDYDSNIFKWCRSIEFPYPKYSDKRLHQDYKTLCNRWTTNYNPFDLSGISIVRHFHPSIYHCHVNDKISPFDAWQDDHLLKKCIANRLIYQNDVDPSKVLAGFNISKIAPKVSVFNPVLARYLTENYLQEFSSVFDPFSGFSGRMIGVCSTGRNYIGQDFNSIVVDESNRIIDYFQLDAEIRLEDSTSSVGHYESILTCPPYNSAEIYFEDMILQDCDDWIITILNNFKCKRYVFVVNSTTKYVNNIVKELPAKSHFRCNSEYVVVIDK